jgi:hypothetical protein
MNRLGIFVVSFIAVIAITVFLIEFLNPVESEKLTPTDYIVTSQTYRSVSIYSILNYNQTNHMAKLKLNEMTGYHVYDVLINATLPSNKDGIILDKRTDHLYTMLVIEKTPQTCEKQTVFKNGTISYSYEKISDMKSPSYLTPCTGYPKQDYVLVGE